MVEANSCVDSLSIDDQQRVAAIVEGCLIAMESGESIEVDRIAAEHPRYAEPLRRCLSGLQTLHDAVHCENDTQPNCMVFVSRGKLGDFVLGTLIGHGGMGMVYEAVQASLDRKVAIKLLQPGSVLQPKRLRRFLFEAKAAAGLQHPNIVPILAFGQEDGVHYYAMQLIAGHSLDKQAPGKWITSDFRSFLNVAIDLADALAHAHECGIIHRDIKPSNLILDEQGKIWITDFGLARSTNDIGMTMTGELVGTVNYMSPEQALGKPVDERTDIYSLGATFYEMLTGRKAFCGPYQQEILRRIESEIPDAPRTICPEIPVDLETIVLKAMSKDREDRYASAIELAEDLTALRDGQRIFAKRPSWSKQVLRWLSDHKQLVGVAMLGASATLLVLAIGFVKVWFARAELRVALEQSQAHYWHGRKLLDGWNAKLIDRLADIPGAEPVRQQMLADTIEYYLHFLSESRHDTHLSEDITTARLALASAMERQGQDLQAATHYQAAIDDLENLIFGSSSDKSGETHAIRKLAVASNDLAVVLMRLSSKESRISDVVAHLNRALSLHQKLQSIEPHNTEHLADRAAACLNLARAFHFQADRENEEEQLLACEKLYREAIEKDRQRPEWISELGTVLDHKAMFIAHECIDSAIDFASEAATLHSASTQGANPSITWLRREGSSLHNLAVLLAQRGDFDPSRERFQQAIEAREKLTRRIPACPDHWADVANSYNALGLMECQIHRWQDSQGHFRLAANRLTSLVDEIDPHPSFDRQYALANALLNAERAANYAHTNTSNSDAVQIIDLQLSRTLELATTPEECELVRIAQEDRDKIFAKTAELVDADAFNANDADAKGSGS